MHLLFPFLAGLTGMGVAQSATGPSFPGERHGLVPRSECPGAMSHFTRQGGMWTRDTVKPKKLARLPPADSYAAVYRLDERGCMVPVRFREIQR